MHDRLLAGLDAEARAAQLETLDALGAARRHDARAPGRLALHEHEGDRALAGARLGGTRDPDRGHARRADLGRLARHHRRHEVDIWSGLAEPGPAAIHPRLAGSRVRIARGPVSTGERRGDSAGAVDRLAVGV